MGSSRRAASVLILTVVAISLLVSPGHAADTQEVAQVDRTAYFTRPITSATPPVLVNGFPPATACLVAGIAGLAQLCGPEITDITDTLGLGDGLPVPETIDADLAQPVLPGTLPIGMAAGQERYATALQLGLPALPEGQEFGTLELLMYPDGLSFAVESPAFRAAVLAVIAQVGDQDPAVLAEALAEALQDEIVAENITGIEACPTTDDWNGGPAQNAGPDGERAPRADCFIGTTGRFDPDIGAWVFDLTFAAQAWTTGGVAGEPIPNSGILLRPLGAENLAYGDPDLSTNWLVSLADNTHDDDRLHPRIRYSFVPALAPIEPFEPDVAAPSAPSFTPPSAGTPSISPGPATPGPATPSAVRHSGTNARYVEPARSSGPASNPWWLMLIVPLAGAGAWALGEALFAGPALATRRSGALRHLIENDPSGP